MADDCATPVCRTTHAGVVEIEVPRLSAQSVSPSWCDESRATGLSWATDKAKHAEPEPLASRLACSVELVVEQNHRSTGTAATVHARRPRGTQVATMVSRARCAGQ
jgi:hypothetical protein